jgi:hypothetical protein
MTERLTSECGRHTAQTDRGAAEQPRIFLDWYLDPTTGKPAARWVREASRASAHQELGTAA